MPVFVGLFLLPVVGFVIYKSNQFTVNKRTRVLLNALLVFISLSYIAFCLIVNQEPFDFGIDYSLTYMIFRGEFIASAAVIFLFTPFMWVVLIHFVRQIFLSLRVRANAVIKRDDEYIYYRDDLDRISPGIIMFLSALEVDIRKSISATILKLKLSGYINEKEGDYVFSGKEESCLSESERMVLNLVRYQQFDQNSYRKSVEKEAVKQKYLAKNPKGIPLRILKIVLAVCSPFLVLAFSIWLDNYVFDHYNVYPDRDGDVYIILENEHDIERLAGEIEDMNDYYHSSMADGYISYNYGWIRAERLKYSVVRKALYLNIFNSLFIFFTCGSFLAALYFVAEQVMYMKRTYRRTVKGKILLNKAYALKNYLKEYSLMKYRGEQELILWEYYLVYAVALGVNEKIEDEVMEKYIKGMSVV